MVFESLFNPLKAEKKSWELYFLGFFYGTLALFLSLWIFAEQASMVMVFLTVMASLPLFYHTMIYEEEADVSLSAEGDMLFEHWRALKFLLLLFLGVTCAYALWYVALPNEISNNVFKVQAQTINALNQEVTGNSFAQIKLINKIFINNVKVLIFSLLFSFIFGSGAVFILVWNASVIGTAMGNFIKSYASHYLNVVGLGAFASFFSASSMSVLRYAIHGVPEILAYFIGGLAGGILSASIIRRDWGTKNFEKILLDVSDLVLIAIFVLFVAALLEVLVTPLFF